MSSAKPPNLISKLVQTAFESKGTIRKYKLSFNRFFNVSTASTVSTSSNELSASSTQSTDQSLNQSHNINTIVNHSQQDYDRLDSILQNHPSAQQLLAFRESLKKSCLKHLKLPIQDDEILEILVPSRNAVNGAISTKGSANSKSQSKNLKGSKSQSINKSQTVTVTESDSTVPLKLNSETTLNIVSDESTTVSDSTVKSSDSLSTHADSDSATASPSVAPSLAPLILKRFSNNDTNSIDSSLLDEKIAEICQTIGNGQALIEAKESLVLAPEITLLDGVSLTLREKGLDSESDSQTVTVAASDSKANPISITPITLENSLKFLTQDCGVPLADCPMLLAESVAELQKNNEMKVKSQQQKNSNQKSDSSASNVTDSQTYKESTITTVLESEQTQIQSEANGKKLDNVTSISRSASILNKSIIPPPPPPPPPSQHVNTKQNNKEKNQKSATQTQKSQTQTVNSAVNSVREANTSQPNTVTKSSVTSNTNSSTSSSKQKLSTNQTTTVTKPSTKVRKVFKAGDTLASDTSETNGNSNITSRVDAMYTDSTNSNVNQNKTVTKVDANEKVADKSKVTIDKLKESNTVESSNSTSKNKSVAKTVSESLISNPSAKSKSDSESVPKSESDLATTVAFDNTPLTDEYRHLLALETFKAFKTYIECVKSQYSNQQLLAVEDKNVVLQIIKEFHPTGEEKIRNLMMMSDSNTKSNSNAQAAAEDSESNDKLDMLSVSSMSDKLDIILSVYREPRAPVQQNSKTSSSLSSQHADNIDTSHLPNSQRCIYIVRKTGSKGQSNSEKFNVHDPRVIKDNVSMIKVKDELKRRIRSEEFDAKDTVNRFWNIMKSGRSTTRPQTSDQPSSKSTASANNTKNDTESGNKNTTKNLKQSQTTTGCGKSESKSESDSGSASSSTQRVAVKKENGASDSESLPVADSKKANNSKSSSSKKKKSKSNSKQAAKTQKLNEDADSTEFETKSKSKLNSTDNDTAPVSVSDRKSNADSMSINKTQTSTIKHQDSEKLQSSHSSTATTSLGLTHNNSTRIAGATASTSTKLSAGSSPSPVFHSGKIVRVNTMMPNMTTSGVAQGSGSGSTSSNVSSRIGNGHRTGNDINIGVTVSA